MKKSLGQHILNHQLLSQEIVEIANLSSQSNVIEIGPGYGALTDHIYDVKNFIAIEKDNHFAKILSSKRQDINVINDDFLDIDMQQFAQYMDIIFIGNLPYNISVPIMFKIMENILYHPNIALCVFMIQSEVAQKIIYNASRISPLFHYVFDIFLEIDKIPPTVFTPPPKVHSSVISMSTKHNLCLKTYNKIKFISNILFSNKRKKIGPKIKHFISDAQCIKENNVEKLNLLYNKRVEQLTLSDIMFLISCSTLT